MKAYNLAQVEIKSLSRQYKYTVLEFIIYHIKRIKKFRYLTWDGGGCDLEVLLEAVLLATERWDLTVVDSDDDDVADLAEWLLLTETSSSSCRNKQVETSNTGKIEVR